VIALVLALVLANPASDLKRARDRYEFGAWADAAGAVREVLSRYKDLPEPQAVEAWRLLGLAEFQLGDRAAARAAFVSLLTVDPDYALDPFLVPPRIVEFFDGIKAEAEPQLQPLREQRRQLREQERLAEEARRKLLAEEQARSGPPAKVVIVQEHVYILNFLPFGAGQFQNGDRTKGTIIAVSQAVLALTNLGAILAHNYIAQDPSRRCTVSSPTNCSNPPIPDSDRAILQNIDVVKYVSAALFWGLYVYGVSDALVHYVPRIETEVTSSQAAVKLSWQF
jgi:tetratricopeptide (TPR) repeat protein